MIYARISYDDGRSGVVSAANDEALKTHARKIGAASLEIITEAQAAAIRSDMRRNSTPPEDDHIAKLESRLAALERSYRALATGQP